MPASGVVACNLPSVVTTRFTCARPLLEKLLFFFIAPERRLPTYGHVVLLLVPFVPLCLGPFCASLATSSFYPFPCRLAFSASSHRIIARLSFTSPNTTNNNNITTSLPSLQRVHWRPLSSNEPAHTSRPENLSTSRPRPTATPPPGLPSSQSHPSRPKGSPAS